THPLFAHVDGTAMGARRPDFFFLVCSVASETGGESFVVDAVGLAQELAREPLGAKLTTLSIEQTESPDQPFRAPIVWRSPGGRLTAYRSRSMRVIEGAPDVHDQAELIAWWMEHVDAAAAAAPRFKLRP